MRWIFGTGLSAAGTQLLFAMLIGLSYALIRGSGSLPDSLAPDAGDLPWLVRLGFLLAAAAAAASEARHRALQTAVRIRQVANSITRSHGKEVQLALRVHLWFATIALSVLALSPAPWVWTGTLGIAMPKWICSLTWSAILSVGVAYFLANAKATSRALRF